ncbi:MAG: patatin-like phospholipase family protein [Pyrinomonadaceae bacterium]
MNDHNEKPLNLAEVLAAELASVKRSRAASDDGERRPPDETDAAAVDLASVFTALHESKLTALCFSGGGIRSATFGLGIIQALAKHKLLDNFDYLSTVSGGGYLGSWLSTWAYRENQSTDSGNSGTHDTTRGIKKIQETINCNPISGADDPNPEPKQLEHLREYSNYMSPRTGLMSADTWTLIAIYLRNLALNLSIFVPLLAAVLLLPRFVFMTVGQDHDIQYLESLLVVSSILLGSVAMAFVVGKLPSRSGRSAKTGVHADKVVTRFTDSDAGVLVCGVAPLVVSALAAVIVWAWHYQGHSSMPDHGLFGWHPSVGGYDSLWFFLAAVGVAYAAGSATFIAFNGLRRVEIRPSLAVLASGAAGAVLLWAVTQKLLRPETIDSLLGDLAGSRRELYVTLSVPLFLVVVLAAATLFVGLSSRLIKDEDREWLARYGAWVLIVAAGWIVLAALVLFGPTIVEKMVALLRRGGAFSLDGLPAMISSAAAAVSAMLALGGGFSERSHVRPEPTRSRISRFLDYAPTVGAVILLTFILIGLAYVTSLVFGQMTGAAGHVSVLRQSSFLMLSGALVVLGGTGCLMGCFVNVNKFSLHGAYRDRLVRAYLGASNRFRVPHPFIGFDPTDNIELCRLAHQRPLHVINATVNLVNGKNLAWQKRKAASFTMTPLHCGSAAVKGYRPTSRYSISSSSGKSLRLGTAMAISGAAANPNMGYYSSPLVTFLMALFNIRLGWWLGNTGEAGSAYDRFGRGPRRFYQRSSPSIAVLPLLNEMFGRTNERKRFLNVTDGGHFENLALYEMVLRRCRFIVLSDGAADEAFKFGEIANAIQKCKVDLGVDINFVGAMNIYGRYSKEEGEIRRSRFALAEIVYPEKDAAGENIRGWLLYTRPTYYGTTEPRDVRYYAEANQHFPHQSTGDQMYDEKQFEAYRTLGFLTMNEIIRDSRPKDIEDLFDTLRRSVSEPAAAARRRVHVNGRRQSKFVAAPSNKA